MHRLLSHAEQKKADKLVEAYNACEPDSAKRAMRQKSVDIANSRVHSDTERTIHAAASCVWPHSITG